MTKKNKKNKSGKRQEAFKVKENPNSVNKKSIVKEKEVPEEDSIAEVLNNALILDDSTEILALSDIKNNNEKQMISPPQIPSKSRSKEDPKAKSSVEQEPGNSNKKSSSSSRNYSYTSSGDSSWMEKDPFEVSYSGSINYNSTKKGTKKGNIAPGGELRTIEDYIALGVPRLIAEMKHPLENVWAFWYFSNDKSRSWEQNQHNVSTVDTIEDFWQVYNYVEAASQLGIGCDYALFKKGIMPDWEDYQNKYGGRWIIERSDQGRMDDMDDYWLETLFMLIGEHIEPFNDYINGAVIQNKKGKFRLAVWLKESKDRDGIIFIGEYIKKILKVPTRMEFTVHTEDQNFRLQGSRSSPANKNKIYL